MKSAGRGNLRHARRLPARTCLRAMTVAMLAATAWGASSCRREQRTFHVLPAEAQESGGSRNTPLVAGGGHGMPLAATQPAPPADTGLDSVAYDLREGQVLFRQMNCAGCHSIHGGGAIGPALSDDVWIYGWQPAVIFDSIVHGRPNGMPSFAGKLPDHQVWQLVAYVRSLSGFASRQAASGRGDDLSGGTPPNSIPRPHPRSSTAELEDLRHREQAEFARRGWVDSTSGKIQVPAAIVQAVATQSAHRVTATRPASTAPAHVAGR